LDIMRILLVEDDIDLAQFIRKGLKEERYALDVAADGDAGLDLAMHNPYALFILDMMWSKLDGLALCRRLRANRKVARCPASLAGRKRDCLGE
jgi:DNA-binding response OmpR family regulator